MLLKPDLEWAVYPTPKNIPVKKVFAMVLSPLESLVSANTAEFMVHGM